MAGVLTWFCVCLYGRGPAGNRALKALGCARRDLGPRAVSAGNVVAAGQDAGVMAGEGRTGLSQPANAATRSAPGSAGAVTGRVRLPGSGFRSARQGTAVSRRVRLGGLLAARPGWLAAGQERRRAQIAREAEDELRRELADALATSVHETWFQELKHAVSDTDAGVIDARWAPEVRGAKREARQLAGELTAEQVRARIGRERDASFQAARYRAGQLPSRALGG